MNARQRRKAIRGTRARVFKKWLIIDGAWRDAWTELSDVDRWESFHRKSLENRGGGFGLGWMTRSAGIVRAIEAWRRDGCPDV